MYYIGIDIGGTKCAVSLAKEENNDLTFIAKDAILTAEQEPKEILLRLLDIAKQYQKLYNYPIERIGISCGGPLDSKLGIIMSPPNLPKWDNIPIVKYFEDNLHINTVLCNDANACALAEWKYGAGIGTKNMIFLTFGTGLGAGLILNGKLYSGTNDMAGEVGHIRMANSGGIGYGKIGSLESFCSGSGIAQLGVAYVKREMAKNKMPKLLEEAKLLKNINAKLIADLANNGDSLCIKVYEKSGEMLGKGLSIIIDILNPELIVLGGIFMRSSELLIPSMQKQIDKEALIYSKNVCKIVPAILGEKVGDYSAIAVALGDII